MLKIMKPANVGWEKGEYPVNKCEGVGVHFSVS